jgi:hypothetical protein
MRIVRIVALLALVMTVSVGPVTNAEFKCEGAACKDVQLWFDSGCHQAKNVGSRKVKVQRGAFSKTLNPGETWQVRNFDNTCISIIIGGTTASYID